MRTMRSSRGVSEANTRVVVSRRFDWIAASIGRMAFLSSISPGGGKRLTGLCRDRYGSKCEVRDIA